MTRVHNHRLAADLIRRFAKHGAEDPTCGWRPQRGDVTQVQGFLDRVDPADLPRQTERAERYIDRVRDRDEMPTTNDVLQHLSTTQGD